MVTIKNYAPTEYPALKKLYEESGLFDSETDSEKRITTQIEKEPHSILLATQNGEITGTLTLLFTERLGLLFRLIANHKEVRSELLKKGEKIFREKGYNEIHIIAQEDDLETQMEYDEYGFIKGKPYRWFWKKT